MDIRNARKVAENIEKFSTPVVHEAFHRLDRSGLDGNKNDQNLAKKIWNYYANKDRNET